MNRAELRALRLRLIDGGEISRDEALPLVEDLIDALEIVEAGTSYRPSVTSDIAPHIRWIEGGAEQ